MQCFDDNDLKFEGQIWNLFFVSLHFCVSFLV